MKKQGLLSVSRPCIGETVHDENEDNNEDDNDDKNDDNNEDNVTHTRCSAFRNATKNLVKLQNTSQHSPQEIPFLTMMTSRRVT